MSFPIEVFPGIYFNTLFLIKLTSLLKMDAITNFVSVISRTQVVSKVDDDVRCKQVWAEYTSEECFALTGLLFDYFTLQITKRIYETFFMLDSFLFE